MRIAHVANTDYFCLFLLRTQLLALAKAGHQVEVVCAPGPLVAELRRMGLTVHTVANARRIDPWADLRTLVAYWRLFRRRRYEVVHTHNPKINLLGALAARLAGVPRVISTLHGLYSHEGQPPLARRFWRTLEALSARLADLILCQSLEDVRTARWQRVVPDARLRPLGNGVDLARFAPERFTPFDRSALRRALGVRQGERAVVFVGRLVREKGVLDLVRAVRGRRGWRLWLIGPDERGAKPDALDPECLSATPGVRWLGLQPDPAPFIAAADAVVLPSYREGSPRSLIEAAALGRPLVATRVRGCREVIEDRCSGLLVPPGRPAELREAIEVLLGDPPRARSLAAAARARARTRFDERAVLERLELAYRELSLVGEGAAGPGLARLPAFDAI